MFFKHCFGRIWVLSAMCIIGFMVLVTDASPFNVSTSIQTAAIHSIVNQDAPTPIAGKAVDEIDKIGGSGIDHNIALLIMAIVMIAIYRGLQLAAGKMKTPMGTMGANAFATLLAFLFGSEAKWKNVVVSSSAPPGTEKDVKQTLLDKLKKDHPLLAKELDIKL